MAASETKFCDKCKKTMRIDQFYKSNNTEKYPDGYLNTCKSCITMHVDNWNPETFLWILQECDVPWIPDEWNKLLKNYAADPSKVTGLTIIGRYLSKMKLKQHREYRWKDTEFLQKLADNKTEQAMKRQGYGAAEIAQVISDNRMTIPEGDVEIPVYNDEMNPFAAPPAYQEDYFAEQGDTDFNDDLTEEDRRFLRLKWGKAYKPEEWVQLEQLYQEMLQSYDITAAGDLNSLKIACKASLKTNQLLDIGDIDGAQKMSKVYNEIMKSGKWTAAQNKAEKGEFVDSVSELLLLCETEGYIERFYIDKPNDKVDFTIKDMQRYTTTLITEETNLVNLVEQALKQNAKEDEDAAASTEDEIIDDDDLALQEAEKTLEDSDFEDFNDFIDSEIADDEIRMDDE